MAIPAQALAWGGDEHSAITAAATTVLTPAALVFLGAELKRLFKVYCNYPDINFGVYYGVCRKRDTGFVRTDDIRRDFNAPFYCDFNDLTGAGKYYGHGPAIAFAHEKPPYPDEHSADMIENKRFSDAAVHKFLHCAQSAFTGNRYFDAIRFLGTAVHYLQDCTPPPHVILVQDMELHSAMESIEDHSLITITGYKPRMLADTPAAAIDVAAALAREISITAHGMAQEIMRLINVGDKEHARALTLTCAQSAARATADLLHTMYELNKNNLPRIPAIQPGVNLLFNPSFDIDEDGDLHPDGWVREWHDPACPGDMHLWDRVSTRGRGACVRLYGIIPAGAAWRTARSHAVPVTPGTTYELSGMIRPQGGADGSSFIALRFQNEEYETVAEFRSPELHGNAVWQSVKAIGMAPADATDALAVCVARDNPRSVLFDDMSMIERN